MPEKRGLKRFKKRLQLRFGIGQPNFLGFTEDISKSGLFIKTTHVFPPMTKLKIDILASSREIIRIEGIVRWEKRVPPSLIHYARSGMGIMITKIVSGEEDYANMLLQ